MGPTSHARTRKLYFTVEVGRGVRQLQMQQGITVLKSKYLYVYAVPNINVSSSFRSVKSYSGSWLEWVKKTQENDYNL